MKTYECFKFLSPTERTFFSLRLKQLNDEDVTQNLLLIHFCKRCQ